MNPIGFGAPNSKIVGEKSSTNPNSLDPKPADTRPETKPLSSLWLAGRPAGRRRSLGAREVYKIRRGRGGPSGRSRDDDALGEKRRVEHRGEKITEGKKEMLLYSNRGC